MNIPFRPLNLLSPLFFLLAGCGTPPPDGVWIFYVTVIPDTEATSAENLTHNFDDAWWKEDGKDPEDDEDDEDEEEWSSSTTETGSEWVFFGVITSTGRDTATLVANGESYAGSYEDDESWVFSWAYTSASSDEMEHESGYEYLYGETETRTVTYDLAPEQDELITGILDAQAAFAQSWTESDTWDDDIAKEMPSGQIPASTYLYVEDDKDKVVSANNSREEEECKDDPCTLNYTTSWLRSYSLRAERTELEEADDYTGLMGAGQPSGVGLPW